MIEFIDVLGYNIVMLMQKGKDFLKIACLPDHETTIDPTNTALVEHVIRFQGSKCTGILKFTFIKKSLYIYIYIYNVTITLCNITSINSSRDPTMTLSKSMYNIRPIRK
jgi:hypothetical protein